MLAGGARGSAGKDRVGGVVGEGEGDRDGGGESGGCEDAEE